MSSVALKGNVWGVLKLSWMVRLNLKDYEKMEPLVCPSLDVLSPFSERSMSWIYSLFQCLHTNVPHSQTDCLHTSHLLFTQMSHYVCPRPSVVAVKKMELGISMLVLMYDQCPLLTSAQVQPEVSTLRLDKMSDNLHVTLSSEFSVMIFYLRPVLVFVSLCMCARQSQACPRHNSSSIQARITKFGLEVQNTLF